MTTLGILALAGWLVAIGSGVGWWMARRAATRPAPPPAPDPRVDELGAQISRLRLTLDGLDQAVVLVDQEGRVVLRNLRAQSPTGTHHGDALVNDALDRQVGSALSAGAAAEQVALLDPAQRVFHVAARLLSGEPGGAVATITDVSDRARLDAVRTDFVSNISHELKTPVGAMSVLAETLAEEDDPEVSRRLAGKVLRESTRLGEMIDDLLELSRIELGGDSHAEDVKVGAVITEAVDRIALGAERRGVSVHTDVATANGSTVRGDRRQLVSAVANLIDNAVKYSDENGQVTVTVERRDADVLIVVADRGIGIAPRHVERIFERFYRVDRARSRQTGGTGLGLAIVRHVALNHGGDITVQSTEGEGSTFTLRLPTRGRP